LFRLGLYIPKKKKKKIGVPFDSVRRPVSSGLFNCCTPLVHIPVALGGLTVWRPKIHPQREKDPTSGQRDKSDARQKYLCEPAKKQREIETCEKSGGFWRRFCRMETSFLVFLTLMSNKNN